MQKEVVVVAPVRSTRSQVLKEQEREKADELASAQSESKRRGTVLLMVCWFIPLRIVWVTLIRGWWYLRLEGSRF